MQQFTIKHSCGPTGGTTKQTEGNHNLLGRKKDHTSNYMLELSDSFTKLLAVKPVKLNN